jgi:omega-amidase
MPSPPIICAFPFDVRPGEVDVNLRRVLEAVERAHAAGAGLLALPEKWPTSFLPSYTTAMVDDAERALAVVHEAAERVGLTVVGSAPSPVLVGRESAGSVKGDASESGSRGRTKPYNQIHFLGAGGDRRPYNKRVLFSPTGEGWQVARGVGMPQTLETPVGKVCALVCYDLRFPELTREAFYQGADLLVVPAQWPHPRTAIFELLSQARAAENQSWLLSCNRAGSASLDSQPVTLGDPMANPSAQKRKPPRIMDFPGTAMAVNPLGEIAARTDDGEFMTVAMDLEFQRQVRKKVPCARDLRQAGLWPENHPN